MYINHQTILFISYKYISLCLAVSKIYWSIFRYVHREPCQIIQCQKFWIPPSKLRVQDTEPKFESSSVDEKANLGASLGQIKFP